jgi:hypothetical protein
VLLIHKNGDIMKKMYILSIIGILLLSLNTIVTSSNFNTEVLTDFDPLVDVSVSVEIKTIRFLDIAELKTLTKTAEKSNPNFYVKVFINEVEFTSTIWSNTKYIYDPQWSAVLNVPDDQEFVNINIQLWSDESEDVPYDISGDRESYDVNLLYSIKTGHWTGDDSIGDTSGYGRLCGCDDGTIYENDRDCELWFDITQNDYDGDRIPYWIEIETLGTDPTVDDYALDPDNDTISTYWEYKWGYDPLKWDNHKNIDPDGDSINNLEEFLTSDWFSDPFRKDVFVEMDIMGDGPNGEKTYFPENSLDLAQTAFNKQNIVFHLDAGTTGGSDIIPFQDDLTRQDLEAIYQNYFLHGDANNWRRGVFHYGLVVYNANIAGYTFQPNGFQISSSKLEAKTSNPILNRDIMYASCYIHELGHTFGFWPIPGHNRFCAYPWQPGWWWVHSYRSCMNYGWTYLIVDYSDGSRRAPDLNDWNRIDYSSFENDWG